MSKSRFYAPRDFVVGDSVELDTEQSRHAIKSRRLKSGDSVELLNGDGQIAIAVLTPESSRSAAVLTVQEVSIEEPPEFDLTIAVAVPKGDRQNFLLDMLTQLGVNRIVPLNCDYSATRANDKLVAKWRRLVIESCKQSGRAWFPEIGSPADTFVFGKRACEQGAHLLLADPKGESWQEYCRSSHSTATVVCLVGPEGGFSDNEVQAMLSFGAKRVTIASHILRIETAAVAIASLLLTV
jgi:16S rRNA (uracil1498-N3)-methyltransferase